MIDRWGIEAPAGQTTIGEAWMLSVREKDMSVIQNGELAGMTMREYIDTYGNGVVGTAFAGGDFPLLIKLIDACDKLSVQVHPDDDYAARVENDRGKTEMWIIVEADDDAEIIYGLKDGISAEQFCEAVRAGRLAETRQHCPVKAGEVYVIPSGMLHAIGKGILIAEIQQNCDLTYRVFDYNRRDKDGNLRELHVEKAVAVSRPFTPEEVERIRFAKGQNDTDLVACPYFTVENIPLNGMQKGHISAESFAHLLCLSGNGELEANGCKLPFAKGDSIFLPAGLGAYVLNGNATLLQSKL